jgi:hypothetical protein
MTTRPRSRSAALAPLAALATVAALGLRAPAPAAACDSSTCLMLTRGTAGMLGRGRFHVDLSFRYTDLGARREGTAETASVVRPKVYIEEGVLIPGYHEDLSGAESALQLDLGYGVAARTTLYASLPVFSQKYFKVGHGGFETTYNVRGIGDLVLGTRQALYSRPQRSLVAALGVKLPTGDNDRIDGYDSTILEPTMQPGTGAGDVILALAWSSVVGGMQLTGSGSFQAYRENDYAYDFGNETIVAATLSRSFSRLTPSLQAKLYTRGRSEFVGDAVPSTGSTVLYLNAGLRYQMPDGPGFYGFLLLPAYRDVNDPQLAPRFSLLIGLSRTF